MKEGKVLDFLTTISDEITGDMKILKMFLIQNNFAAF